MFFFGFFLMKIKDTFSRLQDTRVARNDRSYQALTIRGRTIDTVYYKSASGFAEICGLVPYSSSVLQRCV